MKYYIPLITLAVLGCRVYGQESSPLDLIPVNAAAALVFQNPDALKVKGDKLFEEAGINNPGFRPSQLVTVALQFLRVNAGFDGKGVAAAVLLPPDKKQGPDLQSLVVILSFTDLDQMAANFGLEKGELKPDKVTAVKQGGGFCNFVLARGKRIFIGINKEAVAAVARAKSIRNELAPAQARSLEGADILVQLGTNAWAEDWKSSLKNVKNQFGRRDEPAEQKVVDQFFDALGEMRFGIGGVRVDRGVGVSFMPVFTKGGMAHTFLNTLAGDKGGSNLNALPDGNVVFAQALRGSKAGNAVVAKVLFDVILRDFVQTRDVLSALDRPVVVGFLTEIMNRLEGSRAALYLSSDEPKQGLFSLAAVLDSDDPAKFLADMKVLARIADGTGLTLGKDGDSPERIDVEQLIRDLGDARFRVRESAMLKLRLLGEPALMYLEKARASGDLEIVRRAEKLRAQITQAAALRRKDLLEQDWLRRLQPSFALIPRAEKRLGQDLDVVRIKLADKDQVAAKPLRQLFGPEWHNVRLAVQGKHVVVFLGSETAVLDRAIQNLAESRPGLADGAALKKFRALGSPERSIEFHLSIHKIVGLVTAGGGNDGGRAKSELTSLAVSLHPDRMQLDVWIPVAEFRSLGKRFPF